MSSVTSFNSLCPTNEMQLLSTRDEPITQEAEVRHHVMPAQHEVYNKQICLPFCLEMACNHAAGCVIIIDGGTNIECIPA